MIAGLKKIRWLLLALSLWPSLAAGNSLLLDATTKSLELETSSAVSTDFVVSYADHTSSAFTPGLSQGNITTATTTTILSAPPSSTQRQVKWVTVKNRGSNAQSVTLKLDVSGTEYHIGPRVTLGPGETLQVDASGSFNLLTASGVSRAKTLDDGIAGRVYAYQKTGTAKDAAGYWIAYGKDGGFPSAYSLGSPGLNGFRTDCSNASQATDPVGASQVGAHWLPNPASGAYYLTGATLNSSIAEQSQFVDVLWYNTGIVVTTTTAQTISMSPLPARDVNGTSNGEGVYAALLTTTANTNTGVITNTTISYTNSDGVSGRTGSFAALVGWQAPATPVIGTWMPFQLQAGDRGIRSVQSITLGTSYGGGALSLVLFRPIVDVPTTIANNAASAAIKSPGVRLYNGSCLWLLKVGSASAATVAGSYIITER